MQGNRGESGNEQDLETGNNLGRAPGKFDSIEPGHDNIGQQQVKIGPSALDPGQGFLAIAAMHHFMPGAG